MEQGKAKLLQWHPAFFAGLKIELQEDVSNLIFENEHQLGTKPMEIDVLIIKKESTVPVKKNIGYIFRRYNIIEYKSPDDYLSIDDFYKAYGYCCFYKADVPRADSIPVEEITLTFVSRSYPKKLDAHLKNIRDYQVKEREQGIYDVTGDILPIQIIVTSQLSRDENLWLYSLTNCLESAEEAGDLVRNYKDNKDDICYRSVMNIIMKANWNMFEEAKGMCEALLELMEDEMKEALEMAKKDAEAEGRAEGRAEGIVKGRIQGAGRVNQLILQLSSLGRTEDIIKSASDSVYQNQLMDEFGL